MEKKEKSWRGVNASATMIGDERPSPPLHNQHIVNRPHQRVNPENEAWKHHVPLCFCSFLIIVSVSLLFLQRGVSPPQENQANLTQRSDLTLRLRHYAPQAAATNGAEGWSEGGIQIGLRRDQSDKRAFRLFCRAFTSPNLEGGPCNDVSVLSEAQLSPET